MNTLSVCPRCGKRIIAFFARRGTTLELHKDCPEHGSFVTPLWRGRVPDYDLWVKEGIVTATEETTCDLHCRGCNKHLTPPCCVVLEVTARCNLRCPFCLAAAGESATEALSYEALVGAVNHMYAIGIRSVHLGGGEPTVREDLLRLIRYIRAKGYEYIQLNTNGLRIAREEGYASLLAEAGVDCVFLQFDGTDDTIYKRIRGQALLETKKQTLAACEKARLGVILVPTLIPDINDTDIGNIIRFGLAHMPTVRGIHFQPVTYMGRSPCGIRNDSSSFGKKAGVDDAGTKTSIPESPGAADGLHPNRYSPSESIEDADSMEERMPHLTIPEVLRGIEAQTDSMITQADLLPALADHPLCGFHGEFRMTEEGLTALRHSGRRGCCCTAQRPGTDPDVYVDADAETNSDTDTDMHSSFATEPAKRNLPQDPESLVRREQLHVQNRWTRRKDTGAAPGTLDAVLQELHDTSFTISGMSFMDAMTLDARRMMQCTLRIYHKGTLMPFCLFHTMEPFGL